MNKAPILVTKDQLADAAVQFAHAARAAQEHQAAAFRAEKDFATDDYTRRQWPAINAAFHEARAAVARAEADLLVLVDGFDYNDKRQAIFEAAQREDAALASLKASPST